MIQEKLWRAMLVCSLLFTAGAMGVMLWFSATKTIVIAEEAAPEQGSVLPSESEEDRLRFEAGGVKLALARQTRSRGILMIAAALVLVMNVMIWTV